MPYASPPYDESNVFARILRGEIPARVVLDTPHALAFHDVSPAAPVHVLLVPRGPYTDALDFALRASPEEQAGFFAALARVCEGAAVEGGFRVIANAGRDGDQSVPHFHLHLLAGRPLGPLLAK